MLVPIHWDLRRRILARVCFALVVPLLCFWLGSAATPIVRAANATLVANTWVTDGQVTSIAHIGSITYIGGAFTYVGSQTGAFATLDRTNGGLAATAPGVNALVRAVVADGAGGWFIGGDFTAVGGVARDHLAHVHANGTLDAAWNPDVASINDTPTVTTLAVGNGNVYIGGLYNTVNGQERYDLAAVDATTGALTSWTPKLQAEDNRPSVTTLLVNGSTVYIGGAFHFLNNSPHENLAAVNAITGVSSTWNPRPEGLVTALALNNSTLYVGGGFSKVANQNRSNLAALDASSGNLLNWHADTDGEVDALAFAGNVLYMGGNFNTVGTQARTYLAAVSASNGSVTSWAPQPDDVVSALAVNSTNVYVGGNFAHIGMTERRFLTAISTADGKPTAWSARVNGSVNALAVTNAAVAMGGSLTSAGGLARSGLAALDANGVATAWNPLPDGAVGQLVANDTNLYVSGSFTHIGGAARVGLAAFDAAGALTSWDAHSDAAVYRLAVSGTTLYAAGTFTHIGGAAHARLAAVDTITGMASAWNPQPDNSVISIVPSGATVYLAGRFTRIGGADRMRLAAVDATTGTATSWNPQPNSDVNALAVIGNLVYAGGLFTNIGGQARSALVALDAAGVPTSWDTHISGNVDALLAEGNVLYVGGSFSQDGLPSALVALDSLTGEPVDTIPSINGAVSALDSDSQKLTVGGAFDHVGSQAQAFLAMFHLLGPIARAAGATNISAYAATITGSVNARNSSSTAVFAYTTISGNYSVAIIAPAVPMSIVGANDTTVSATLAGLQPHTTYYYHLTATNADGSATSAERSFTTLDAPLPTSEPPVIMSQPASQTIEAGQAATLVVSANGTAPLSYQWYAGSSGDISALLAGATRQIYITPVLMQTTSYWVRVTNAAGSANSATATVTVHIAQSPTPSPTSSPTTSPTPSPTTPPNSSPTPSPTSSPTLPPAQPPAITGQPTSQTVAPGQPATLSVVVSGADVMSYQWYEGSSGDTHAPIAGATDSSYTTPALRQTTSYWARITDVAGSVDSATATIIVVATPAQRVAIYLPVVKR